MADLEVARAGGGLALVHSRDSGQTGLYRIEVANLLLSCTQLRTLEDHLGVYMDQERPQTPPAVLRRELRRLAQAGYLTSPVDLRVVSTAAQPMITSLAVTTCDRTELLCRALHSYVDNVEQAEREADVVVVDDSAPRAQALNRAALHDIGGRRRLTIRYAGQEEKSAYVRMLTFHSTKPMIAKPSTGATQCSRTLPLRRRTPK